VCRNRSGVECKALLQHRVFTVLFSDHIRAYTCCLEESVMGVMGVIERPDDRLTGDERDRDTPATARRTPTVIHPDE
jgi:hypothetical protein